MKIYYSKVLWFDDSNCKEIPEELFVKADSYVDAVAQITKEFRDSVVSIALYEMEGKFLFVTDLKDLIDEGRRAVNIPNADSK